jgi:transcriptional regulator with XRE-family HTH domain
MYDQLIPNIKKLLDDREMSLYRLAHEMKGDAKTNLPWLSRLMNGKIDTPRLESIHAIANALAVPIEKLIGKGYEKKF